MEGDLVNIQPPVQKIKMVNQHNLREVFKAHRVVDRPVKGFGALLPAPDMSEVPEALTTNQVQFRVQHYTVHSAADWIIRDCF